MEIFGKLIKYEPGLLEKPLKELLPISFVGAAAVTAYRSLVGKLDSLPMTQEQKEKTLRDGQDAGKMLLSIEGRIGELLPKTPNGVRVGQEAEQVKAAQKESGFTKHQRQTSWAIADHPKIVEEVIVEAEENEDIPTKTAVLNKIQYKKEKDRREKYEAIVKEKNEQVKRTNSKEAIIYLNTLQRITLMLPAEPPKDWSEEGFAEAQALSNIIRKRLEIFHG